MAQVSDSSLTVANQEEEAIQLKITSEVPSSTSKARILIKGTTRGENGVFIVEYSVNDAPFQKAKGVKQWQFKANLAKGKNKIVIATMDAADNVSTKSIVIRRR